MIKAISIDFWGTLCSGNKQYSAERLKLISAYTRVDNHELIKSAIKSVKNELFGVIDRTGLFFNGRYVCSAILSKLNCPVSETLVNTIVVELGELFIKHPPTLTTELWHENLGRWRSKCHLWVLSNTMLIDGRHMRKAMMANGLYGYFAGSIFSDEEGFSKPNPLIYKKLIQEIGVVPSEILHIGDNQFTDIAGPETMGMKTILFNRKSPFENESFKTL